MRFLVVLFLSGMLLVNAQVAKVTLRVKAIGATKKEARKNANRKYRAKIYKYVLQTLSAKEREICQENQRDIVGEVKRFILGHPEVLEQEIIMTPDEPPLQQARYKLQVPFNVLGFKKWLRGFILQKKEFPTVIIEVEENLEVLPEGLINPKAFKGTIEQMFIEGGFDVRRKSNSRAEIEIAHADEDIEALIALGRQFSCDLKVKFDFKVSLKKKKIYGTGTTMYEARCTAEGDCVKVDTNAPYATVSERRRKKSLDLEDAVRGAVLTTAKKSAKKLIQRVLTKWARENMHNAIDVKISNIGHSDTVKLKDNLRENSRVKHIRQVSFAQRMVVLRIRTSLPGDRLMGALVNIVQRKLGSSSEVVRSAPNYIWLRLEDGDGDGGDGDEEEENDF